MESAHKVTTYFITSFYCVDLMLLNVIIHPHKEKNGLFHYLSNETISFCCDTVLRYRSS